jgi:hypothetical protein
LFRSALGTELGAAFNLGAAFRAKLLLLDGLAALRAELRAGRDARAAIRTSADHGLLKLLFGHIGRFLRYLAGLLHSRFCLRRRIFRFQVWRALKTHAALRVPARVVDPFGAALALLTVTTSMTTSGSCFNPTQLICPAPVNFPLRRR